MSTDTPVSDLIVNKLTYAQWKTAKDGGTLSNTETYDLTDKDTAFVHTSGNETIRGYKTFANNPTILGDSTSGSKEGGEIDFGSGVGEPNTGQVMKFDRYNGTFRFFGANSSGVTNIPLTVDIEHNHVLGATPPAGDNSNKIATTGWVKSNTSSPRDVGEIVESKIPLTDSGLHLLDGGVIQRGSYTAFVDYIAGLYNTNPNADYFCQRREKPWVQPIATAATTTITGGDMVITTSSEYSTYNGWKAMDGVKSGTNASTGWGTNNTSATQWWQLKLPYQIRITGIRVYHRYDGTPANSNTIGRFYTSSAMTTPIGSELNDMSSVNWSETTITGIPAAGIATDTLYFQKTGGGNYGGLGEVEITATVVNDYMTPEEVWQYSVDTYGSCDKFVYDSTAKTVRLPKRTSQHGDLVKMYSNRVDWYRIYVDGWCEQGGFIPSNSGTSGTITFLKPFVDTNYIVVSNTANDAANNYFIINTRIKTVSSVSWYKSNTSIGGDWYACGYVDISNYQYNPIYEYIVLATTAKTQIQVDIDEVMTDLNAKVDKFDLSEVHCVVETYQNGGDWYRLYDDGWVEQGGSFGTAYTSYTQKTFSFLKPFMTTNYFVTCHSANTGDLYYPSIVSKSLTDVTFYGTYNLNGYGNWYACGYGE